MKIAESVHEVTSFIAADLGDHLGEEGVGSDVEGDAKKQVGGSLVKLTGQSWFFAFDIMNVELKKKVAGGQGHFLNETNIPSRDQMPTGMRIRLKLGNEIGHLVDSGAIGLWPRAPLLPVDRAEITVLISPFIPDGDSVFLEVGDVGISFEKPEKLMDNGA